MPRFQSEPLGTPASSLTAQALWSISPVQHEGRGLMYADVTEECRGKIEKSYALNAQTWRNENARREYFERVNKEINKISRNFFKMHKTYVELAELFSTAFKALVWQETRWQHYLKVEDRFFIIHSYNSMNALGDWGITQISRSGFSASELHHEVFFREKNYCKISESLKYSFEVFFASYLAAFQDSCNQASPENVMMGAYNHYASGVSTCFTTLSAEPRLRAYQQQALQGFQNAVSNFPWKKATLYFSDYAQGGIVRGPRSQKRIALVFTAGERGEGMEFILDALENHHAKASFFFNGDFLRNPTFYALATRAVQAGHYVGPHLNDHWLLADWKRRRTLVSKEAFANSLRSNVQSLITLGMPQEKISIFLPPYEHYNSEIAEWSRQEGLLLATYTPGTLTPTDWILDDHKNFRPSRVILESVLRKEAIDPYGLNGFHLLIHAGTEQGRKDKFYFYLPQLITLLTAKGYTFDRIDRVHNLTAK